MSGQGADDVGFAGEVRDAQIAASAVGFSDGPWCDVDLDQPLQAGGPAIVDHPQAEASANLVDDLDRGGGLPLAFRETPATTCHRIILVAAGNLRIIDLSYPRQERAAGGDHGPAQLAAQQPSALGRPQAQLPLHLPRRDAVPMGGDQIRRPEADREHEVGAVHYLPRRHRDLAPTAGPLHTERLAGEFPYLVVPAQRAAKIVRPARRCQLGRASKLLERPTLDLDEPSEKVGHSGRSNTAPLFLSYPSNACHLNNFLPPEARR